MTKEESGKCSYENCGREIFWPEGYTPQPEEKPFCIFHSPLIEQKKTAFRSAWQKFLNQHITPPFGLVSQLKYRYLYCRGFIFPEKVDFIVTTFGQDACFEDTTFSEMASFNGVTFKGKANFINATFNGEAQFARTKFSGEASFFRSAFIGEADFTQSTFSRAAWFFSAIFSSGANFILASFHDEVSFYVARWKGGADFSGARLKEASLDFIGSKYEDENKQEHDTRLFEGDKEIGFDHVNFREAKRVRFEHVDLSRASFLRSQIENVDFIDVWWKKEGKGHKIYDEREWREEGAVGAGLKPAPTPAVGENTGRYPNLPYRVWTVGRDWIRARIINPIREEYRFLKRKDKDELKEIENLYHQLILNFDRRRDYETGGEFYVRENECRRIRKGWRGYFFEGIYWLTSEYGQRWVQPLLWGLLVVVLSSLIFFQATPIASAVVVDRLDLFNKIMWPAFCLNVASLFGITRVDNLGLSHNALLLLSIQRILIFYLISMFLLAVRRRFRR